MNNLKIRNEQSIKAIYSKPSVTELNTSAGTQGTGVNAMGMVKSLIGVEGGGGMDSPS